MSPATHGRIPVSSLTRANLASRTKGYVKKGAWNKADVLLADVEEGQVAIKDYAAKIAPIRWLGAWQLTREEKAYTRLEGMEGIPQFFGRIDRNAIVMEYVGGTRLPKVHHRQGGVPQVARRVKSLLACIHARGIIHGDLRSRDNFLVTESGELYLIDFSSAAVFRPGSWGSRLIFPRLRRAEERALLKWKVALAPEELTPEEIATHLRFKRLRRLWPFNRKKDLPETKGRNPLL